MNPSRRHIVQQIGLGLAGVSLWPHTATAQSEPAKSAAPYPIRPITIVLPGPAGGATDVIARALAQEMSKGLGQPVVVDNKPGASGMIAAQMVAKGSPDGYTVLLTTSTPIYYAPFMFPKMAYDPARDLAFLTHVCDASLVLAVNKDVPAKNMAEFITWAKKTGNVAYGSYGVGSAGHLMAAYLSESRQLGMTHVAYKGEPPMVQDLIGGQIPWAIATTGTLAPYFANGRLRPLAILGEKRVDSLPQVPTMAEAGFPGPEYLTVGGLMLMTASGVPRPVRERLESEARAAIHSAPLKARFQAYAMVGVGNSAEAAQRTYEASAPVIEKLVKVSGAKME